MKCLEIPAPKWRRQYSSKFAGSAAPALAVGAALRLDHTQQALLDHLGRQAVQVRLVGVAREDAMRENSGLARDRHHLPGQELVDHPLHRRIAQVQPVAGLVELVPLALVGARVPAQPLLALEQHPGRAQVRPPSRCRLARRPGSPPGPAAPTVGRRIARLRGDCCVRATAVWLNMESRIARGRSRNPREYRGVTPP